MGWLVLLGLVWYKHFASFLICGFCGSGLVFWVLLAGIVVLKLDLYFMLVGLLYFGLILV